MQSMDQLAEYSLWEQALLQTPYQPQNSQSHNPPSETWSQTCSEADEEEDKILSWSVNQSATTVPNQNNVSRTVHASPNTFNSAVLKRNNSMISDPELRAVKKRNTDREYRERCKRARVEMQDNLFQLTGENESLKKENEYLKKDNADMHQTLKDQAKEIERLRNDLSQLKREWEKQNVLVQTLSGFIADPVQLENEKLKDENASLRKNANLYDMHMHAEENARLKLENKVLKVQNDALCGKIISDNERKHEQEQEAKISTANVL